MTEITEKKVVAKKAAKKSSNAPLNAEMAYRVLVEPWITEKSHGAMASNKYTFKVVKAATKREIKKAIEGFYQVSVAKIAVINIAAKKKSYGRYQAEKQAVRKAVITLKEGDKIELFQGA